MASPPSPSSPRNPSASIAFPPSHLSASYNYSLRLSSCELELSPLIPSPSHVRMSTTMNPCVTVKAIREKETMKPMFRLESLRMRLKEEEKKGLESISDSKAKLLAIAELAFEESKIQFSLECKRLESELSTAQRELKAYCIEELESLSPFPAFLLAKSDFLEPLSLLQLSIADIRLTVSKAIQGAVRYSKTSLKDEFLTPFVHPQQADTDQITDLVLSLPHTWPRLEVAGVAKVLYDAGKQAICMEDYETAEMFTTKALGLLTARFPASDKTVKSLLQMGRIHHIGFKRLAEAEKTYLQAISLCEKNIPGSGEMVDACASLTGLCASMKEIEKGESWFQRGLVIALEYHPQSLVLAKLYRAYACLKRQCNQIEASFEFNLKGLALSLSITPNSWDCILSYLSIAVDYRDLGRFSEAEDAFRRGTEINPPCAYVIRCWLGLSRLYRLNNRKDEATSALKSAVNIGLRLFPNAKCTKEAIMESTFSVSKK